MEKSKLIPNKCASTYSPNPVSARLTCCLAEIISSPSAWHGLVISWSCCVYDCLPSLFLHWTSSVQSTLSALMRGQAGRAVAVKNLFYVCSGWRPVWSKATADAAAQRGVPPVAASTSSVCVCVHGHALTLECSSMSTKIGFTLWLCVCVCECFLCVFNLQSGWVRHWGDTYTEECNCDVLVCCFLSRHDNKLRWDNRWLLTVRTITPPTYRSSTRSRMTITTLLSPAYFR